MALNNNSVVVPSRGYIFFAPVGTAEPTPAAIEAFDPETGTMAGWTSAGHTSRDELPSWGFDGGDTSVLGSWQNSALREVVTEAATDYVTWNSLQFDEDNLRLYYSQAAGGGATIGRFGVVNSPTAPIEQALLIIIVDGGTNIGFYANKASIRREDAIELEIDGFAALPLRATFLKNGSADLYAWISLDTNVNS